MNRIATIVKGYPRLSETFIAQEILGLEKRPPALRPGMRLGARASRRRRLDPHALPPPAGFGRALCCADPRHELVVLRARQGYLDDAGMGSARQARRSRVGGHLHARQPRLSAIALHRAEENPP